MADNAHEIQVEGLVVHRDGNSPMSIDATKVIS
jgi:hypothetical protein